MSTIQLMHEFLALGCEDEIKRGVAARVYIDLVDVAKVQELKTLYDVDLLEIYFTGKESKDGVETLNIYLPVSCHNNINFIRMEEIQEKLSRNGSKSIVLCICDTSSTVLYYKLTQGFQPKRNQKSTKEPQPSHS